MVVAPNDAIGGMVAAVLVAAPDNVGCHPDIDVAALGKMRPVARSSVRESCLQRLPHDKFLRHQSEGAVRRGVPLLPAVDRKISSSDSPSRADSIRRLSHLL